MHDKTNYPNDPNTSSPAGEPLDSTVLYYPFTIKKDSHEIQTKFDSFSLGFPSRILLAANEPVLYNYYLGHEQYRFLWNRSFDPPVIITIHKKEDKVLLNVKKLDKHPVFLKVKLESIPFVSASGEILEAEPLPDSIFNPDKRVSLVINQNKQLSLRDWQYFEKLLQECQYFERVNKEENFGCDGATWTIEAHLKNQYWVVKRWSPKDKFRKCGEYLIGLSQLKEEVY